MGFACDGSVQTKQGKSKHNRLHLDQRSSPARLQLHSHLLDRIIVRWNSEQPLGNDPRNHEPRSTTVPIKYSTNATKAKRLNQLLQV